LNVHPDFVRIQGGLDKLLKSERLTLLSGRFLEEPMTAFFEAESLSRQEADKLEQDIERRIAEKLKDGTLTEREVCEIEEMRLRPLADIQDVQSVLESHLFDAEK
jgi:hypothetical protein